MSNEMTYSRTTLNNIEWQLVSTLFGNYALYRKSENGYVFSGYTFKTMEEGIKHLDSIDERISHPMPFVVSEVPADYYGVANRYYGD